MKKLIILLLLIAPVSSSYSQDSARISPYLTLQYFKNNGDSSYLTTTITYSRNRIEIPVQGLKLTFRSGGSEGKIISEAASDSKGVVICALNREELKKDADGFWDFAAAFSGNDTIEASSAELKIRDAFLVMECTAADSIKTVSVRAEKLQNGKMVPAAGELVNVYVPRMFSFLPIGEITLDEEGKGSVEFPSNLPGDLDGFLRVVARFEEHAEFGNIEKMEVLKWGIPYVATTHTSRRALWTKTAPKWMIYTLSVLLAGVWSHYLFAIISLIRIKLNASKNSKVKVKTEDFFAK